MRATWGNSRLAHQEAELVWSDALIVVGRCAFCPTWSIEDTADKVRAKARLHRERKHPETLSYRRKSVRGVSSFKQVAMDEQEIVEVKEEIRRRAFQNGVDVEV